MAAPGDQAPEPGALDNSAAGAPSADASLPADAMVRMPANASVIDPSGELHELAGDCVHCGFCLPACPTYQLWGEEMDSPRGRIHLITQLLNGAEASAAAAAHIDRCLGCMACVPACPSGVRYDRLIEAARGWTEEPPPGPPPLPPRSLRDRAVRAAIFQVFPYPRRLRLLMAPLRAAQRTGLDGLLDRSGLADRLSPELAAALRVAPPAAGSPHSADGPAALVPDFDRESLVYTGNTVTKSGTSAHRPAPRARWRSAPRRVAERVPARAPRRVPERVPARGPRRAVVGMLVGCVQQVFFPQVNTATARVLAAEGCDVISPKGQGCCGALPLHGGRLTDAAKFARQTIEVFERAGVDAVIVNAAGCGSAMKDYAELLAGDPVWTERAAALAGKVRDFSEFLVELGPAAARHPLRLNVAYHDACHLAHAQRVVSQPRELLRAIPGLNLAEIADGGTCCGSAGIYNLVQPEPARELGERKARTVQATGAALLVSGNPGCSMQIAAALAAQGSPLPMAHIAEVLDASIRAQPASSLLGSRPA
jgi:glycolate oxidase iron-sulfur subunit